MSFSKINKKQLFKPITFLMIFFFFIKEKNRSSAYDVNELKTSDTKRQYLKVNTNETPPLLKYAAPCVNALITEESTTGVKQNLVSNDTASDFNEITTTKSDCKKKFSIKAANTRKISVRSLKMKSGKSNRIVIESEQKINSNAIPFLILIKDTRIASMLFVVSIVFVATYLPSILATRSILPNDNLYIVYLYFTNSAANPFINLFINRSFRYDLFRLLKKSTPSFSIFSKKNSLE